MTMQNQSTGTMQNCATQIQATSYCKSNLKMKRYDTSNYNMDRPLTIKKSKKLIGLINEELSRRIMKEFLVLRSKMYSYLIDDGCVDKKA